MIISAPSGSGKTTVVRYLLNIERLLRFSVSATSRNKRAGEKNGEDYYFISEDEFRKRINSGDFVEWEEVYPGIFYGTLKSEIERAWNEGKVVIFDVDVKGGLNLKKYFGEKAISIFIKVENLKILEERLRRRRSESETELRTRLEKSAYEMTFEREFDYVIVNDNLERCCTEALERIHEFLLK